MRKRTVSACLFLLGTAVCGAQPYTQGLARRWADHYAAVYHVPSRLVHSIIEVESNWNPRAVSAKGAVGLMQVMPGTAVTYGVTNRFDVEQNVRGGVAYLARLVKVFDGDLRLVAAAYLAGENRILAAGLGYSNAEVYHYVRKIARVYREKCFRRPPAGVLTRSPSEGDKHP